MRYSVELKPGQVAKDIALGIQMTKIPEPRIIELEAPEPPGPCTWDPPLTETFTGTGLLTAHTGDSGQVYPEVPDIFDFSMTPMILESGELRLTGPSQTGVAIIECLSSTPDYYIEVAVRANGNVSRVDIGVRVIVSETEGQSGYKFSAVPDFTDPENPSCLVQVNGGSLYTAQASPLPGNTFTMRLEVLGDSIKAYIDGVLQFDGTDASDTEAGSIYILMFTSAEDTDGSLLGISSYSVGALP